MSDTDTQYHENGVIAFVPNQLDTPDIGMIGVFVKDEKDRLFFYPWLPAVRSKSEHVLNTPVQRTAPNQWRLQPTTDNSTDWFDPFVPTNESPVRLKRVAKTKARSLSSNPFDWDNLEYSHPTDADTDALPTSPATTATLPPLNDSSLSSPQA